MNRKMLYAMLILALAVIVLLFNGGSVKVNLLFGEISAMKSLVFLVFMGLGVSIGVLLK